MANRAGVKACDFHQKKRNIEYFNFLALITKQNAALGTVTQYAIPSEFGEKSRTKMS